MKENLNIEGARLAHLPEIFALEQKLFKETAWNKESLKEEITSKTRKYFVLTDATGKVHGYGGILVIGQDADVQTMAVSPEYEGSGHGRKLLKQLMEEASKHGATRVFLEVREDNPRAIHLYDTEGFEIVHVREGYYQPEGVSALVMIADIKNRKHDE